MTPRRIGIRRCGIGVGRIRGEGIQTEALGEVSALLDPETILLEIVPSQNLLANDIMRAQPNLGGRAERKLAGERGVRVH